MANIGKASGSPKNPLWEGAGRSQDHMWVEGREGLHTDPPHMFLSPRLKKQGQPWSLHIRTGDRRSKKHTHTHTPHPQPLSVVRQTKGGWPHTPTHTHSDTHKHTYTELMVNTGSKHKNEHTPPTYKRTIHRHLHSQTGAHTGRHGLHTWQCAIPAPHKGTLSLTHNFTPPSLQPHGAQGQTTDRKP